MLAKRLRLILSPINTGGECLIELDGTDITDNVQALHLTAEVGQRTRAVLTLTNLRVDVEAEAIIELGTGEITAGPPRR
jgi:hypothetical protein